jgi:hypothetical protein
VDVALAAPAADDDVPIACTLDGGAMADRLDEWQQVLAHVTARTELDGGVRLELDGDTDVAAVAQVAAAEQACCRFFDFALVIDRRGVALEVHAPPDGQPVLTALFG